MNQLKINGHRFSGSGVNTCVEADRKTDSDRRDFKQKALFAAIPTRLKLFNRLRISNNGKIPVS